LTRLEKDVRAAAEEASFKQEEKIQEDELAL